LASSKNATANPDIPVIAANYATLVITVNLSAMEENVRHVSATKTMIYPTPVLVIR
jgi:uncharacterized membrane protein YcaP (DUF421 family)